MADCCGELLGVVRWNKPASGSICDDLRNATNRGRDHRLFMQQRLEHNTGASLLATRRNDQHKAVSIQRVDVVAQEFSDERDPSSNAGRRCLLLKSPALRPITDEDQLQL